MYAWEAHVSEHTDLRRLSRRAFLLGGVGATTIVAMHGSGSSPATALKDARLAAAGVPDLHLAATDGWVSIADPTKFDAATLKDIAPFWPDTLADSSVSAHADKANLYVFGFRNVTGLSDADVTLQRGRAQISAPQLAFDEGQEYRVKLSNLGLSQRPDLVDGHTIHWHGFVNAIPLFDGVPELSISVPIGRSFTYYYRPFDPGTYMYHCHFEDVEHVQMGMTGLLFVRPKQNGNTTLFPSGKYVFNDGDGSTGYHREFGFMLTEIFAEGHYRDAHIQTTDWTDYKASFWALNGRTYPDTVAPNAGFTAANKRGFDPLTQPDTNPLKYKPQSSLVNCNAGEKVLLRLSNLGYQNHAITVDAIPLTIVGKDASQLKTPIVTNTVDIGPGESRDVIFTAPAHPGAGYDTYLLYDRAYSYASNAGQPGQPGGMTTEIRVYAAGSLPLQTTPNA